MKRRWISFLLALAMALGLMPAMATSANAYSGSDFTTGTLAERLESIIQNGISDGVSPSLPPLEQTFPSKQAYSVSFYNSTRSGKWSGYQCMAYAYAAYNALFHWDTALDKSVSFSKDVKGTKELSYDLLQRLGVRFGAYIRTTANSNGSYNASKGHSMLILGYDKEHIYVLHAMPSGNGTYKSHISKYKWKYINDWQFSTKGYTINNILQPPDSVYDSLTGQKTTNQATTAACDHSAGYKTVQRSDGTYTAVCKSCGAEYVLPSLNASSAGTYKAGSEASLCAAPYQDSKTASKLKAGDTVSIAGSLKNAYGNLWYNTTDGKWVYSAYLSPVKNSKTTISFSNLTTPGNLAVGSVGHIDGRITSSGSPITSVKAEVINNATGAVATSSSSSGFSVQSYGPLKSSKVDNNLKFGTLAAGTYYIKYTATAEDGTSASAQTATFQVGSDKPVQNPAGTTGTQNGTTQTTTTAKTTLTFTGLTTPGDFLENESGHVSGKITSSNSPITSVTADVYSSTGEKMATVSSGSLSVKSYDLSKLNYNLADRTNMKKNLNSMPYGTYYIRYTAKAKDGTSASAQTDTFRISPNLKRKYRQRDVRRYLNFIYDLKMYATKASTEETEAVKRFQSENDLTVTGTVDSQTFERIVERYLEELERNPDKEAPTRLAFTAVSRNAVHGCVQLGNSNNNGICDTCATVTLLRRKQYDDVQKGKCDQITFNIGDLLLSRGVSRAAIDKGFYPPASFSRSGSWTDSYTVMNGKNTTYTTKDEMLSANYEAAKERVIALLQEHPEGVAIWNTFNNKKNSHAFVITRYEDGQFYAIDSVPNTDNGLKLNYVTEQQLENTYMYTSKSACGKSMKALFCGAYVWYVV